VPGGRYSRYSLRVWRTRLARSVRNRIRRKPAWQNCRQERVQGVKSCRHPSPSERGRVGDSPPVTSRAPSRPQSGSREETPSVMSAGVACRRPLSVWGPLTQRSSVSGRWKAKILREAGEGSVLLRKIVSVLDETYSKRNRPSSCNRCLASQQFNARPAPRGPVGWCPRAWPR
jgi:hypothetical protein